MSGSTGGVSVDAVTRLSRLAAAANAAFEERIAVEIEDAISTPPEQAQPHTCAYYLEIRTGLRFLTSRSSGTNDHLEGSSRGQGSFGAPAAPLRA